MMSIEQIIEFTEALINDKTGKSLSFIQKAVLSASLLETKKYAQIALENNYSKNYIRQLVAPKLWQLLSNILGEKVNRTNCRAVLEQRLDNSSWQTISQPAFRHTLIKVSANKLKLSIASQLSPGLNWLISKSFVISSLSPIPNPYFQVTKFFSFHFMYASIEGKY